MANKKLIERVGKAYSSGGNMITKEGMSALGQGIKKAGAGIKEAKDKIASAVTGGATDALKKPTVPTPAEQEGIDKDEIKVKDNPNSFMSMQSSFSNSPFNYNAALVDAVAGAFGSSEVPVSIRSITGGLYEGVKAIADESRKAKDELLKQDVSLRADTSEFTEKEINNLIALKNEYADVTNQLSKPFVGRKKKQELNAELNKINSKTANYIKSVNHMMDLQASGIKNDEMRAGIYNKQENMLWDQIITGNARDMAADNFDINTGKTYFANPHGTEANPIDVLSWDPLKTMNAKWISNDTNLFNKVRTYAKDEDTPRELIQEQIGNVVSANYYSDPTAIYDSAGIDSFVDYLYGSEDFDKILAEKFPSEYKEMQEYEKAGKTDLSKSLYKQLMRKVDVSSQWIDFRTNQAMSQYDDIRNTKKQSEVKRVTDATTEPKKSFRIDSYNEQGTYVGVKYYTEDEMREMFDKAKEPNTEEDFNIGRFKVKVRSGSKGNRIWQVYSLDGKTPVGKGIYYSLAEVLKKMATIDTEVENNDFAK